MKKNIMIFLSVIFIFMISLTKVHAYNSTNFYLNYNDPTFLSNLNVTFGIPGAELRFILLLTVHAE